MEYFLAHNDVDVFIYGKILEEQVVETGQPYLEFYNSLDELKDRLLFFNVEYSDADSSDRGTIEEEPSI